MAPSFHHRGTLCPYCESSSLSSFCTVVTRWHRSGLKAERLTTVFGVELRCVRDRKTQKQSVGAAQREIRCSKQGDMWRAAHKPVFIDTAQVVGTDWPGLVVMVQQGKTFPIRCYQPAALPSTHFLFKQNKRPRCLSWCLLWSYLMGAFLCFTPEWCFC